MSQPLPTLINLWKHQVEGVARALAQKDFALLFEAGTGKSATTVNILRGHYVREKRIMRTLILCPVIVVENWKREFGMHSKIDQKKIFTLTASGKKRCSDFSPAATSQDGVIAITNFEALCMKDFYALLLKFRPEIIVCDESQRIRNYKAIRTKKAIALADLAAHKFILSGTPILNTPMDIYAQYRFLDGGESFGKNFFEFRGRYFEDKNARMPAQKYFPNWQPRAGSFDKFHSLIYQKGMRVIKSECLDLPPIVRQRIEVGMTPAQKKNYLQMETGLVAYLNDKACVANLALTKSLRLLQIVSGFFRDTDDEDVACIHYPDSPRLAALRELLEDISPNEKVIIWACFRENYVAIEALLAGMKISYCTLYGGLAQSERVASVDAFQTDPEVRVMVANQQAGGVGINLTAASTAIYFSRNYSLENDMQSEARNHRGGSEIHSKITRIDLVTKGTIEETVLDCLERKENVANQILALKVRLSK